jgi:hypothetical protein
MMRPIDADALDKKFERLCPGECYTCNYSEGPYACALIGKAPTVDVLTRQQADIIRQALPDLKKDIDEIITMKDTFIYHLVMDAIERKIRGVEKAMRTE